MDAALTQVRETYEELIKAACSQPGVFEVMQVMQNVSQQQHALSLMHSTPLVSVTVTSSSMPPAKLFTV